MPIVSKEFEIYCEDKLERQRDGDGRQHHHAHAHEDRGHHQVDHQERHEQQKADLESTAQFADDEGGNHDLDG